MGEQNQSDETYVPQSGLLIEVEPAESIVSLWRLKYAEQAEHGIPAHVTVLFPFIPPALIDEASMATVRKIVSNFPAFDFELTTIEQFPGVVWLRPEPDDRFRALTRELWDAFPQCPPYENRYPDPQPHLTIGQLEDPVEQAIMHTAIESELEGQLPIGCRATSLTLFVSTEKNEWTRPATFDLAE